MTIHMTMHEGELLEMVERIKVEIKKEIEAYLLNMDEADEKDCVIVEPEDLIDQIDRLSISINAVLGE